jgi:hypothetical protein
MLKLVLPPAWRHGSTHRSIFKNVEAIMARVTAAVAEMARTGPARHCGVEKYTALPSFVVVAKIGATFIGNYSI